MTSATRRYSIINKQLRVYLFITASSPAIARGPRRAGYGCFIGPRHVNEAVKLAKANLSSWTTSVLLPPILHRSKHELIDLIRPHFLVAERLKHPWRPQMVAAATAALAPPPGHSVLAPSLNSAYDVHWLR